MFIREPLCAEAKDSPFEEDELHEGDDTKGDMHEDLSCVRAHRGVGYAAEGGHVFGRKNPSYDRTSESAELDGKGKESPG